MITQSGLQLFGITFSWYGLIVIGAIGLGALVAQQVARRAGLQADHLWSALIPVASGGLVGARLWFVCFPPQSVVATGRDAAWLLTNFVDLNQGAIAVWSGGLGWFGALLGGAIGLAWYCWRHYQPHYQPSDVTSWGQAWLHWADIAACGIPLAHAFGRIGNAINQDLYGAVTTAPWGLPVTLAAQRVARYTDLDQYPLATTLFQPLWAYELIWCVAIAGMLWGIARRHPPRGTLLAAYLALYGLGRAVLEGLRSNVSLISVAGMTINISQVTALACAAGGILIGYWLSRRTHAAREAGRGIDSGADDGADSVRK